MKLKRRKHCWRYAWIELFELVCKFGCDNVVIYNTLYYSKPNLAGKGRKIS